MSNRIVSIGDHHMEPQEQKHKQKHNNYVEKIK